MKYLIVLGLCILLVACSRAPSLEVVDNGNFSWGVPSGWVQQSDEGLYTMQPVANSTEKISFFATNVPRNMTTDLQKLVELGLTSIHTQVPDLTINENATPTTLGTLPAIEVKFSGTMGANKMVYTQIFAKPRSTIYTLTYSCTQGSCSHDREYQAIAKSIVVTN